jgi:hypothetical protein
MGEEGWDGKSPGWAGTWKEKERKSNRILEGVCGRHTYSTHFYVDILKAKYIIEA